MAAPKKYKNREERLAAKRRYHHKNKDKINAKRRAKYLENKFQKGMNWKNQGRYGWHIDHIKPCSKFDLSDPDQQKKCFNYKNLQPLWAAENIKKSNN